MSYQGQSPKVNRLRFQPRSTDPVNPAEGDMQYADGSVREEGIWVYKNSAWVKVGSDQTGDINYISNGDAEAGNTAGWSLGNVTLTNKFPSGVPTFGSGASANLSFTNSSSAALAGTRSFVLASSAATTAGNFLASDAFTIDAADLAKVLSIDITYKVDSGTINASGTSNNSFGIAIYDVTASQWIMPAGVWAITQSSGAGRAVATFQTPITSTSYRLVLFNANATSGAVSLKLDRISVGPVSIPVGAPVTDFVDAGVISIGATTTAPAKASTTVVDKVQWKRIGDSAHLVYKYSHTNSTGSTAGSGDYLFSLPSGLQFDSTKVTFYTTLEGGPGGFSYSGAYGTAMTSNPTDAFVGQIVPYNSTQFRIMGTYPAGGGCIGSGFYPLNTAAFSLSIDFIAPISGWSSQVQMSSDTDTRVCAVNAWLTSNQSVTANTTNIPFDGKDIDTHNAFSSGVFTVPITGIYEIKASTSESVNANYSLFIYKNGTVAAYLGSRFTGGTANGTRNISANAGDTISIRSDTNQTFVGSATSAVSQTFISINRLSGPAVVAANESVACRYTTTATISNTTAYTVLPYATKDYDTHSSYNTGTGVYTAPVTGKFLVSAQYAVTQGGQPVLYMAIYKNGSLYSEWNSQYSASTTPITINMTDTLNLNAGDTISIYMKNSVGAVNIQTTAGRNFLNILKIGN